MAIVPVLVDKKQEERKFFEKIKKRSEEIKDMAKNPFNTEITMIASESHLLVLMDIEPIYPDIIPKIGLFLSVVAAIFGWTGALIGGLFLTSTWLLWTPRFFYIVLKKARKKEGLKGTIRLLSHKEAFRGVARAWDR